jgi:ATP-binding cassette, subfamily B, bacterial PglK
MLQQRRRMPLSSLALRGGIGASGVSEPSEQGRKQLWTTVRQAYDLVGRERPFRWVLLIVLAMLVSGLEMVGAVLVYALLTLVADPEGDIDVPLVGDLRERFEGAADETLLLWTVAAMAVFFLVRAVVKVASKYIQARIAHNAGARLSIRMFEGYLRWPYPMHLSRTTPELIRNGHQAVMETIDQVVLPTIRTIAESLIVAGLLVVLVLLAPLATLSAVVVIGGTAILLLLFVQPKLKDLGQIRHREARSTLATMQQGLFGIRDVKVLGRERAFAREYGRSRTRMARAAYLREAAGHLPNIVFELSLMAFIIGFFAFTIIRAGGAQDTLSVLGLFAYAGLRMQPSMQLIIQGLNSLKFAAAPLEDLHRDLQLMADVVTAPRRVDPLAFEKELRLDRVGFRYEGADRDALQGIELVMRPGEQIGICGPTGGGKTTLTDIITGLLQPTAGRVTVDGHDLTDPWMGRRWQASLGIVAQMVFLTDDTLRRNIAFGIPNEEINDDALQEAVTLAQLESFVAELPLGLATTVGERGVRVSGGQRQRIAIARALYRKPEVLIFDEGTSALDNATEAQLMAAIEQLRGDHTIILVAHRLSTVRSSDRIVFLEHGQMTGLGTYDELREINAAFRHMAGTGYG